MLPPTLPKFREEQTLLSTAGVNSRNNNFKSWDLVKYYEKYYVVCFVNTSIDSYEGPWEAFEEAISFMYAECYQHER